MSATKYSQMTKTVLGSKLKRLIRNSFNNSSVSIVKRISFASKSNDKMSFDN